MNEKTLYRIMTAFGVLLLIFGFCINTPAAIFRGLLTIFTSNEEHKATLEGFAGDLATVFIVSQASVLSENAPEGAFTETESGIAVLVEKADGHKCDRCWTYSTEGVHDEDGFICERCRRILES